MIPETVEHVAEQGHTAAQQIAEHGAAAAQHAAEHGGETGVGFMLHHIMARPLIKLPTVAGVDLTITNHTLMMWIVSLLLILAFGLSFRRKGLVAKGRLANALEALVLYIRDNVLRPNLGHEGKPYESYLLTAFFFVLLCNLLGLVPYAATATGNIGVTAGLAIMTLITVLIAGIRKHGLFGYLKHFMPHGIPWWLGFVMVPVEVMSLITKHFALTIRLFANMIAGHLTILSLMSIIFIFKSAYIAPFPFAIMVFSSILEILIAFIQAYVFTILSSVFIGASLASEH
jgi:F-type H+-transporting ATPase subunit a